MALHDGRAERLGQDDEVALRAGRAVEHDELVRRSGLADQPARQAVGKRPRRRERRLAERLVSDRELGRRIPSLRIRRRCDDRPEAGHAPLVNRRTEGVVELDEQVCTPLVRATELEAVLGELLDEPPEPGRARGSLRSHAPERYRALVGERAALSTTSTMLDPAPARSASPAAASPRSARARSRVASTCRRSAGVRG